MPPASPLNRTQSAGYLTNWAARLFARAMDERLKPLGLTSAYLPVIFALADGQPLSQKALVQLAAIEQPTMAATLNRMVRDGLLTTMADPNDKRSTFYDLTSAARAKVSDVQAAVMNINAQAFSGLPAEAEQQLLQGLKAVIARLSATE